MKFTFDSENFFTTKRVVWMLLAIAAVIIVYHLGYWHGVCDQKERFKKHLDWRAMHSEMMRRFMMNERQMGQVGMFNVHAEGGMPMRDIMYFRGQAGMMGASAAVAQPIQGIRVIKMDGGEGKGLFFHQTQ